MVATEDTMASMEGDITGGLSDRLILSISFAGFSIVGAILYIFVLRRSPELDEDLSEGKSGRTYEDELDDADVRTLNRSQLRARAKHRMKKARRIARERTHGGEAGEDLGHDVEPVAVVAPDVHVQADEEEEDLGQSSPAQHLSRKARSKAAKVAEREERRRYAELRRERTEISRKEREEKEKKERAAEAEARQKADLDKREQERANYEDWNTMFTSDEMVEGACPVPNPATVADFLELVNRSKVTKIQDLATHYSVKSHAVEARIQQLQEHGRITGIIDAGYFIHITQEDMQQLSVILKKKKKTSLSDFAESIKTACP